MGILWREASTGFLENCLDILVVMNTVVRPGSNKCQINFSASSWVNNFLILAMLLKWKKALPETIL